MQLYTACYFLPVSLLPPAPTQFPVQALPGKWDVGATLKQKRQFWWGKIIVKEDIGLLMSKYHKIGSNKSPNIFGCQRIVQMNI